MSKFSRLSQQIQKEKGISVERANALIKGGEVMSKKKGNKGIGGTRGY